MISASRVYTSQGTYIITNHGWARFGSKEYFPPASVPDLKSFILGSETEIRIVLLGYDELGRPVTIPVNAF